MKISYDPDADAAYLYLTDALPSAGETVVEEDGTIVDLEGDGSAKGFEWLMVSSRGISVTYLPDHVVRRVHEAVEAGLFESRKYVEVSLDD